MTEATPEGPPVSELTVQPYYIRQTQSWAVHTERQRHSQVLYAIGEWACFALMWHLEDHQQGLVDRCHRCWIAWGKVAQAYGQPSQFRCPDCYGTSFEGGYRAIIVRPAIFTDTNEGETVDRRGIVHSGQLTIEMTTDFRCRQGDYCFRATGDRYRLDVPNRTTLRTGFSEPNQREMAIGYESAQAYAEDPSSVAYDIPPRNDVLVPLLVQAARVPQEADFSSVERINAPLIPTWDQP